VENSTNSNDSTTTGLDQTDEDILTYEVSDEALEAAAGIRERAARWTAPWTLRDCCHGPFPD
jgi:hypothetical protein